MSHLQPILSMASLSLLDMYCEV